MGLEGKINLLTGPTWKIREQEAHGSLMQQDSSVLNKQAVSLFDQIRLK